MSLEQVKCKKCKRLLAFDETYEFVKRKRTLYFRRRFDSPNPVCLSCAKKACKAFDGNCTHRQMKIVKQNTYRCEDCLGVYLVLFTPVMDEKAQKIELIRKTLTSALNEAIASVKPLLERMLPSGEMNDFLNSLETIPEPLITSLENPSRAHADSGSEFRVSAGQESPYPKTVAGITTILGSLKPGESFTREDFESKVLGTSPDTETEDR